eukprot:6467660-Amphidinium_carterae.1
MSVELSEPNGDCKNNLHNFGASLATYLGSLQRGLLHKTSLYSELHVLFSIKVQFKDNPGNPPLEVLKRMPPSTTPS